MYILILNNSYLKIIIIDNKKEIYKKRRFPALKYFISFNRKIDEKYQACCDGWVSSVNGSLTCDIRKHAQYPNL